MEDVLRWKTPFGGRRLLVEDDLGKTTLDGRRQLVEDNLSWKMTLGGRRPSVDPCMLPSPLCGIFLKPSWFCTFDLHQEKRRSRTLYDWLQIWSRCVYLKRSMEVNLNPARCRGDILSMILCPPPLHKRHPTIQDKVDTWYTRSLLPYRAHFSQLVHGLKPVVDWLRK